MTGSTDSFAGAGVVLGIVDDVDDPLGQGRVRVTFPFLGSDAPSNWAPIAAPMAGKDRGFFMVPELGDEAVVLFERGDPSYPIIIGFTYNGQDSTPAQTSWNLTQGSGKPGCYLLVVSSGRWRPRMRRRQRKNWLI